MAIQVERVRSSIDFLDAARKLFSALAFVLLFASPSIAASNVDVARPIGVTKARSPALPTIEGPFEEALIAQYPPSFADRAGLVEAIRRYRSGRDPYDFAAFERHLDSFPHSAFKIAVLTNIGLVSYRGGYFTRAMEAWRRAWESRSSAGSAAVLADRAGAELLRMHARLGHPEAVDALLSEFDTRTVQGTSTEWIAGAREGLWKMRNEPGAAYLCGPRAMRNLVQSISPGNQAAIDRLDSYRSGSQGVSLGQLQELASLVGLGWKAVRQTAAVQSIPVPSVVHWKHNHYAAVVDFRRGRYLIKDPTLGHDLWMTPAAVMEEASGFFVVPSARPSEQWRLADAHELVNVYGRGLVTSRDEGATTPQKCEAKGCARYLVHETVLSLSLVDTPVTYRPGRGQSIEFTVTYNHREADRPDAPTFSNMGPKWTHNWLSYIRDDPQNASATVRRFEAGGGYYDFPVEGAQYRSQPSDGARLVRTSSNPVTYELHRPDGSKLVYGLSDGGVSSRLVFLTKVVDPNGNTVSLGYDAQRRLISLTDASGGVGKFEYGESGRPMLITRFISPAATSAELSYDSQGRLASVKDAVGIVSSFQYGGSAGDFVEVLRTPYGVTRFSAGDFTAPGDNVSRWLQIEDAAGAVERYEVRQTVDTAILPYSDPPNSVPSLPLGGFNGWLHARNTFHWTKDIYAKHGGGDFRLARIKHWLHDRDASDRLSRVLESYKEPLQNRVWMNYPGQTSAAYSTAWAGTLDQPSAIGRVLPDGRTQLIRKEYNGQGNITREIDPAGRETVYEYAANGSDVLAVKQKAAANAYATVASYVYNSQHRPLTYTDAAGKSTTFTYNPAGQVVTQRNAKQELTTFEYDSRGYLIRVINSNGRTQWAYTYDAAGNVASRMDSQGHKLLFEYDGLNRLTRTTWPDGSTEVRTYDKLDLASVTNRKGVTTTYEYDAVRNLVSITEPINGGTSRITRMTYYPGGGLKTLTDPNGNTTTWERDIQGRVTKKTYADGKFETYAYDTAGRLESKTDAKGIKTTWSYADDDRMAGISFPPAANLPAGTAEAKNVSFTWDPYFPRVASMTDGLGTTQYGYGPPGALGALQLISDDGPWGSDIITQTYDELGRLSTRTLPNLPNAATSIYLYDTLGRVSIEAHPGMANSMAFGYLGETDAEQGRQLASGGFTCGRTYAPNTQDRRLTSIDCPIPTGGNLLPKWSYEIDELDRVTTIKSGRHESYFGYDSANRLTSRLQALIDPATGQGPVGFNLFTLDAADNLLNVSRSHFGSGAPADTAASFSVNALNQAVSHTGTVLKYDANGNLTEDGGALYTWDARDRLVAITSKATGAKTTIQYDGLDRWAVITDSGREVRYRWCGQELCAALDTAGKAKAHYFGDRGMYVLLPSGQPQRVAFVTDHLGSVKQYHDTAGNWLLSLDHEAYGSISRADLSPAGVSLLNSGVVIPGWAGLYMHWPTGTYLATYRPYSSQIKRWLKRDPIGENGGVNLYGYVDQAPLTSTDALGLFPSCRFVGVAWVCGSSVSIISSSISGSGASGNGGASEAQACSPAPRDPCKGLRDQLRAHEEKLRDYIASPSSVDNLGILAAAHEAGDMGRVQSIISGRIANLAAQIENFRRLLAECERRHGR